MTNCPWCGNPVKKEPDHVPLSFKRRAVFNYIRDSGPMGVSIKLLIEKFFPTGKDATVRTTIHHINSAIRPMKVVRKGGIVRLMTND